MTKELMTKDLADKLIAHYEFVISKVNGIEDVDAIKDILYDTDTIFGICNCAALKFGQGVYSDIWVKSFGRKWWCDPPSRCRNKDEILLALQFRVDRLKTF